MKNVDGVVEADRQFLGCQECEGVFGEGREEELKDFERLRPAMGSGTADLQHLPRFVVEDRIQFQPSRSSSHPAGCQPQLHALYLLLLPTSTPVSFS